MKSEVIFWSLIFFVFRYVEGGVLGNNNIGIKKCTTNFLWVLNFGEVGEIFKNFQNHTTTVTFFKNGLQLVIFEKITWDFLYKIEGVLPRSGPCSSLARSGQSLYPGEAICPRRRPPPPAGPKPKVLVVKVKK